MGNSGNAGNETHVDFVATLTAAIQNRWAEAHLTPCAGDAVRAGLAALEILDMALDADAPLQDLSTATELTL